VLPGPLLDLPLENGPLGVERAGVIRVAIAEAKQAVIGGWFKIHGPQYVDETDFRGWFCEYKAAVVSRFCIEDTVGGQPAHYLGEEGRRHIDGLGKITGQNPFVGILSREICHGAQSIFGRSAQVHLENLPCVFSEYTFAYFSG